MNVVLFRIFYDEGMVQTINDMVTNVDVFPCMYIMWIWCGKMDMTDDKMD